MANASQILVGHVDYTMPFVNTILTELFNVTSTAYANLDVQEEILELSAMEWTERFDHLLLAHASFALAAGSLGVLCPSIYHIFMSRDTLKFYQPPTILDDTIRLYSALVFGQAGITLGIFHSFGVEAVADVDEDGGVVGGLGSNEAWSRQILKFKTMIAAAYAVVFILHAMVFLHDSKRRRRKANAWNRLIMVFVLAFIALAAAYAACAVGIWSVDLPAVGGQSLTSYVDAEWLEWWNQRPSLPL